jgi:hypothetical protein
MAIKSVIKRAAKHLPWSPDAMERIMRVIESDNAAMGYGDEDDDAPAQPAAAPAQPALTDERSAQAAQQVPTTRRGSRMANILRQHQQPPVADAPPPYDDIPWEDDPRG